MSETESPSAGNDQQKRGSENRSRFDLGLVSADTQSEKKIRAELDRVFTENLLAHSDAGDAFARDLAAASLVLPTLSEIDNAIGRLQAAEPSPAEIEELLAAGNIGSIAIDGVRVAELLDQGPGSVLEQKMLKRGLSFLKREMYAEATEWWILNRPQDELSNNRLYLLLTLLLTLTYKLSGNHEAAESELHRARSVSSFRRS